MGGLSVGIACCESGFGPEQSSPKFQILLSDYASQGSMLPRTLPVCLSFYWCVWGAVMRTEPRESCMLGECSSLTYPAPQASSMGFIKILYPITYTLTTKLVFVCLPLSHFLFTCCIHQTSEFAQASPMRLLDQVP